MAIPESQLRTWSNQGATVTSASTHKTVENCIKGHNWNDDVRFITYLQGSYPNYTNIYGNSDVDLIVEFRSIFSKNLTKLTEEQRSIYKSKYDKAKYSLAAFKTAIIKRLNKCFDEKNVIVGDKAILVKGGGSTGRLDCDVLVCNPYRNYNSITETSDDYIEGILFETEETKERIINYPKVHLNNGANKNTATRANGNYKPTIRVLKNIKAAMVNKGYIVKETAPSYFLECLLYNSLDSNYRNSTYQSIALAILNQFKNDLENGDMENYLVQNEQRKLFGTETQQWNIGDATTFVRQIIKYWNEF
jgi:hypothetical protein